MDAGPGDEGGTKKQKRDAPIEIIEAVETKKPDGNQPVASQQSPAPENSSVVTPPSIAPKSKSESQAKYETGGQYFQEKKEGGDEAPPLSQKSG